MFDSSSRTREVRNEGLGCSKVRSVRGVGSSRPLSAGQRPQLFRAFSYTQSGCRHLAVSLCRGLVSGGPVNDCQRLLILLASILISTILQEGNDCLRTGVDEAAKSGGCLLI